MNKKKDEIIFGAKRAGVTWLHKFQSRAKFNRAKVCAKRLGLSLSQLLCDLGQSAPLILQTGVSVLYVHHGDQSTVAIYRVWFQLNRPHRESFTYLDLRD